MNFKILITGASGSIGSELARQIYASKPKQLIIIDQDETGIFNMSEDLPGTIGLVADVRNRERIQEIFKKYKPDIVFHAAAYKHVPLMERQIGEAVRNNIFGTLNVAESAVKNGAKKFVFVSTDKAVNPTSVMGATKRIGEMICQNLNGKTKFMSVRFGNVFDSRGSVIPAFKKQIERGGPVIVTHPEMRRYFMSIKDAAELVIQASKIGKGGEIFILDMGKQIKILDLAKQMILQSGKDIHIMISEPRPGEKLFEELLIGDESSTKHKNIFIVKPSQVDGEELDKSLIKLKEGGNVKKVFNKLIPTYEK